MLFWRLHRAARIIFSLNYHLGNWTPEEVVESGEMSARECHDAIIQGGRLPVEPVGTRLTGQALTPDYESQWRFYGDP